MFCFASSGSSGCHKVALWVLEKEVCYFCLEYAGMLSPVLLTHLPDFLNRRSQFTNCPGIFVHCPDRLERVLLGIGDRG